VVKVRTNHKKEQKKILWGCWWGTQYRRSGYGTGGGERVFGVRQSCVGVQRGGGVGGRGGALRGVRVGETWPTSAGFVEWENKKGRNKKNKPRTVGEGPRSTKHRRKSAGPSVFGSNKGKLGPNPRTRQILVPGTPTKTRIMEKVKKGRIRGPDNGRDAQKKGLRPGGGRAQKKMYEGKVRGDGGTAKTSHRIEIQTPSHPGKKTAHSAQGTEATKKRGQGGRAAWVKKHEPQRLGRTVVWGKQV